MRCRLFPLVSLFVVLALLSALAPTQVCPLAVQAQSDFPTTPVASQEEPAGFEPSLAQAFAQVPETAVAAAAESARGVELVGQIGGEVDAVAIQGSYAYVGVGQRLTILNIANPGSPTEMGKTDLLGGLVAGVAVSGSYAYVADRSGLRVVDVANPAHPYEVGFYDSPGYALGVAIAGGYAYVADASSGLRVVNISIPSSPFEVGFYDTPGSARDVALAGSYAYVADGASGLRVVNISTPSNPYQVGYCDTPGSAKGVAVAGSYAYIADGDQGLRVMNISNPSNPWEAGHWVTSQPYQSADDVAISGSYAYVAYYFAGLEVVNISVPSNPWEVGSFPTPSGGFAVGVAISGSYAYVACGYMGLRVANISTPSNPYQVGRFETMSWAFGLTVVGNYAYVADGYAGLKIINVATPSNPTLVGFRELYGASQNVVVSGSYAYVADGYGGGLQVLNISNPSNPYPVGYYRMSDDGASDVALAGNHAYVTFGSRGLRVLSISSPSNPYEVGFYDTPGQAYGVAVAGGYAYVADGTAGLRVVNISTPSNPYQVGSCDTPGEARGVAVDGSYAYVADLGSGVRVVDVSVPSNPHEVAFYDAGDLVRGVTVADDFAYVAADGSGGLRVVNVATPTNPIEVGFYDTLGNAFGVTVGGGLVYVADLHYGLSILRPSPLAFPLASFVAEGCGQIATVGEAAADVAEVGDYFLDKLDADAAQTVVNLGFNTIDLLGVDWDLVGLGLEHMAIPGYKAALHASWRGWMDDRVAKHWYKPLYDKIKNDRELLFGETARSMVKYYAQEAGIEAAEGPIKNWLLAQLVPGPGTPVADLYGQPAQDLGVGYCHELERELGELLAELPDLGLTPEQEQPYIDDLEAHQEALAQIVAQAAAQRDLLWDIYQDAVADEVNWWKFWTEFLVKYAIILGATAFFDGPGYVVTSAAAASFDLIYDALSDIRALEHDQKMLDQAKRFMEGRVSLAYEQIGLNAVNAMNLIRAGDVPQIAAGDLGEVVQKSLGHYRLWPKLWWAEESSQVELSISNTTDFSVTYLTSASYTHTGFWTGAERLVSEGESPEVPASSGHTAVIRFKGEEDGLSPDDGSAVDLLILGASETGLYPVASTQVLWNPLRIETLSGAPALLPSGFASAEADSVLTLPYPLSSVASTLPGSTEHTVSIAVENPFTMTVSAIITQTVPGEFSVADAGGAALVDDALVWTDVLSPHVGLELRAVLRWEAEPGDSTVLPGPTLFFQDPDTGQGDTYTAADEEVFAPWPLEVTAAIPLNWEPEVESPISVTLSNVSSAVTADGDLEVTIRTPAGTELWSMVVPIHVEAGQSQVLTLQAEIVTEERFAVVSGEVVLGSERKREFLEVVSVWRHKVHLPLVFRSY